MNKRLKDQAGFTLIEILIVIIILGILAMIIIPQISVSTDDAKVSTLKTNLSGLRSSIEVYYAQHSQKYPGMTKAADGAANVVAGEAATSMVLQLTQYTRADGMVSTSKVGSFVYGPYVKGGSLPANPFNEKTSVDCSDTTDITLARTADNSTGWRFHFRTGVFFADDSAAHAAY